ncbi:zeatin O-glucosyltransferase-like [Salvia miltiorrhiza]|uniref:zeatin O-glucosyltransferase-like n=1 Tax=Salvia miltiorrhiza TaxID=226208 RepID=UPI0025AD22C9|nr:zeatin O-glucosyltransferase-like [Salvia miltiorrhiza]
MTDQTPVNKNVVQREVAVVAVPFPAQSHLNSLLHLCRRISAHNLAVHYVGTATHVHQVTARVHGCDPSAIANLHFHGFPTSPHPNHSSAAAANSSAKFPSHLLPTFMAILPRFKEPLLALVDELKHKKVVIIFDALMASVVGEIHQSFPNVECYSFQSCNAFFVYSLFWEVAGKMEDLPSDASRIMEELPSMEGCFSIEFQEFLESQRNGGGFQCGTILNTSRVLEGFYFDLLAKLRIFGITPEKHWALGPLSVVFGRANRDSKRLDWLDNQPENSVVFVSFGTTCSLSEEEMREVALGLEMSEVRFIWSLRDADRGDVFEEGVGQVELPVGFEERVRERGVVVREWAPQLEILAHGATGGFLTHCGWNSCLESISMGVPMAAWPMHSDQPRNAALITKVLKIGVGVRNWGRRDEVVGAGVVEESLRRLMGSTEGEEMRRRAKMLARALKQSMEEGGASEREMDSFISHIIT